MTNTVPLTHLTPEEVKAVLSEYRINSADIAFRCDATVDDLIDVLEGACSLLQLGLDSNYSRKSGLY